MDVPKIFLVLGGITAICVGALVALAFRASKRSRFRFEITLGSVVVLTVLVSWFGSHAANRRILARASTVSGVEMCLVQELGDPFAVHFYFRTNGGNWGWFYVDHETWYWRRAKITIDETNRQAKISHGWDTVAVFDWEKEAFTLYYLNRVDRTRTGAQSWRPPGWEPGMRR